MKKAVGIDLGTTNSVVAFKDTVTKIIRNKENEELTRSCVGLRNEEILVGSKLFLDRRRDPINTIFSIKRLMGAGIKDKMVQEMINSSFYKFGITSLQGGTDTAVAVLLGGKQYTPEQISAEILKKLKADTEEKLGDEVTHVVITVPAYFTEKQKNATRVAAKLAGLKIQKLLAEPTAAAIAYGVDSMKDGDSKTVLIYDFGGGTFDLSILNIVDGQYMEAGTGGDRWLGGDDIDRKLQELVLEKVAAQYRIIDIKNLIDSLPDKKKFLFEGEIRLQTEIAKIQLSSAKAAQILIDNILEDSSGDIIDVEITITREEFEKLIEPFIERTIELIEVLLKEVGYDISMIDSILLVGGTSCIPLVKQKLAEKYGTDKIKVSEKPMLAIAEGAAILSQRLGEEHDPAILETSDIGEISYSTNHNYYIEVEDKNRVIMERVIEKQTPLPVEVSKVFKTTTNNQKIVKVGVYSDVEEGNLEKTLIGFYLIEENLPIGSELTFEFRLDVDEIFTISVSPKSKKNQSKKIVLGRGNIDTKALQTIDNLIARSVKEFKTVDGEELLLNYVSNKIKEIETKGVLTIEENTWHEIYYTTTEKFDEIKANEEGVSDIENIVYTAKRLVVEFSDIIEPFDKNSMITLITQIDTSIDDNEKSKLAINLKEKTGEYGLLNSALQIESLANRILNIPSTSIGLAKKEKDVEKLNELSSNVKTKLQMGHVEDAKGLMDEAYEIITQYKYAF